MHLFVYEHRGVGVLCVDGCDAHLSFCFCVCMHTRVGVVVCVCSHVCVYMYVCVCARLSV